MVAPISKASVGTSADAARMSAYATMISTFYRVSPKTNWHCTHRLARLPFFIHGDKPFPEPALSCISPDKKTARPGVDSETGCESRN